MDLKTDGNISHVNVACGKLEQDQKSWSVSVLTSFSVSFLPFVSCCCALSFLSLLCVCVSAANNGGFMVWLKVCAEIPEFVSVEGFYNFFSLLIASFIFVLAPLVSAAVCAGSRCDHGGALLVGGALWKPASPRYSPR